MIKFKTPYNYDYRGSVVSEVPKGVSATVPGQAESIQSILAKFAMGLPVNQHFRVPVYHGEQVMPDIERMDKVELEQMRRDVSGDVSALRRDIDEERKRIAEQNSQTPKPEFRNSEEDKEAPAPPQYPKKTRGAGAEPRDTRKGGDQE